MVHLYSLGSLEVVFSVIEAVCAFTVAAELSVGKTFAITVREIISCKLIFFLVQLTNIFFTEALVIVRMSKQ